MLYHLLITSIYSVVQSQNINQFISFWSGLPTCAQNTISRVFGTKLPTSAQVLNFCFTLDQSLNTAVQLLTPSCTGTNDQLANEVVSGFLPVCVGINVIGSQYNVQALELFWSEQRDCFHTIISQQFGLSRGPPAGNDIAYLCSQGDNIGGIIASNMDPTICPGFTTDQIPTYANTVRLKIKA
ncbi:hypothetical protein HK100_003322 [Physocladia obscura]|uniref:Uncharacterized protein n=1 Tax=Physocladia obscura TaxID=109957 RepID=A0AAD5T6X5_9FUNG|nr:hypothetical protein HK100_003322 [Physocladia obscura]